MAIPFDLWGQRGWAGVDVVGESHYAKQIRSLLPATLSGEGIEVTVQVCLRPDPTNRHDRNAVGVWHGSKQLGHLPRGEAGRYTEVLSGLVAQGWEPRLDARVWGAQYPDYDGRAEFNCSVRLDLAEPHMLVPANLPPSGAYRLLPTGGSIQVNGEEKHLDVICPLLGPHGESWVHVTLHEISTQTARTTREIVEVRIDGARVGQLTPKMSAELLPAIRHLADPELQTAARAIVKGNRIKAEVVLYVARAHELPESWLDSQTPVDTGTHLKPTTFPDSAGSLQLEHSSVPPPPTGIRFVVPANWPQPPAGWVPPPGWQPDPTWPPAPAGWQWWVPIWD